MDDKTTTSIQHMVKVIGELSAEEKTRLHPIVNYLKTYDTINHAKARTLTGKSSSAVNLYLARLVELNILVPEGSTKARIYRRAEGPSAGE